LPRAKRQHAVMTANGVERRDALYEEWQLLVELDGRLGHEGLGAFKDMQRDNAAAVRGEVTLRYGWFDVVSRPCEVARQIAKILRARGWLGSLRPCAACSSS
jgi:very-short-patch-repair endonuclease